MLLFPFLRFQAQTREVGADQNEPLIWSFRFHYLKSKLSLQTGGLPVDKRWLEMLRHAMQTFHLFSIWRKCTFFFLQGSISYCCQAAVFSLKTPHLSLKTGLESQALSPDCSSPAVCRGRYGTMLFPLALLLEITACDCDKWIFPLNSLVEWGIPLTTGTIPTQVKHWVIFFLWARVKEETKG